MRLQKRGAVPPPDRGPGVFNPVVAAPRRQSTRVRGPSGDQPRPARERVRNLGSCAESIKAARGGQIMQPLRPPPHCERRPPRLVAQARPRRKRRNRRLGPLGILASSGQITSTFSENAQKCPPVSSSRQWPEWSCPVHIRPAISGCETDPRRAKQAGPRPDRDRRRANLGASQQPWITARAMETVVWSFEARLGSASRLPAMKSGHRHKQTNSWTAFSRAGP